VGVKFGPNFFAQEDGRFDNFLPPFRPTEVLSL